TGVLTGRILRLIRDQGVPPERILAITFTNTAAGETRGRVSAGTGSPEAPGRIPPVMTFHSFGHALLRERPDRFGRDRDFRVADEDDALELLGAAFPECADVRRLLKTLRRADGKSGPGAETTDAESPEGERQPLAARYEEALRSRNLFDFSDLLARPLQLFREDAEWARTVAGRYDHILVDEFQDVDEVQYEWIRCLAGPEQGPHRPSIWAVGDPDQSIYGFRGASPDFLLRFPTDFPGATVYRLTRSYRCPDTFLRASGMILTQSSKFKVQSSKEEKSDLRGTDETVKVRVARNATEASEAEFISRTIEAMTGGVRFFSMDSGIASGAEEEPMGFSDFAVLCRIGRQFPALEKAFRDHGIPYRRSDTEPFYRREPARTIVKALKKCSGFGVMGSGLEEKSSGFRVPGSGFKETSSGFRVSGSGSDEIQSVARTAVSGKEPVRDLILRLISLLPPVADPADRIDLELLAERSVPFGTDLPAFLTALALGSGPDWARSGGESVSLFTLHAAKGLEFPCVFIAGVEDGLLPYTPPGSSSCDPEEERRLLYVGMTRAKRHLILSHADRRELFGRVRDSARSPFLDDIGRTLLGAAEARGKRGRMPGRDQLKLF
ncbi:MAG: ATP-dependent helicase, partial [bacterium]|nr:ATP-dependent helicase [bacterium]